MLNLIPSPHAASTSHHEGSAGVHGFRMLVGAAAAGLLVTGVVQAEEAPFDPAQLITAAETERMREILAAELVRLSIDTQNQRYGDLTQSEIDALDRQWRAEREADDQPLIAMTLSNPLSTYLTRMQASSFGLFTAIFVMDRNGLNVGQSAITGDYWQGDEAKFENTYPKGAGAVFVDQPEFVDEVGIWIAQVNMTVADRESGRPIGAVTFDVNLTELARRQQLNGS